jgi:predicted nucleic acid-binding protein
MILVDTSIWIDHFRNADADLINLLQNAEVLAHPFVIGEIALGNLRNRGVVIAMLSALPRAIVASDAEVLRFIDMSALVGQGIGYIDSHLLASTKLTQSSSIWTRDKRLKAAAARLSLSAVSYR